MRSKLELRNSLINVENDSFRNCTSSASAGHILYICNGNDESLLYLADVVFFIQDEGIVFYCVCLLICFWIENVSSIDSVVLTLAQRLPSAIHECLMRRH